MLFESLFNNYDYWRKDGEKYSREIELPGVKKGDLKVRIDGDLVRLYFERGGRKGALTLAPNKCK
jgi:HSP20 family molecular chaperone IbpA